MSKKINSNKEEKLENIGKELFSKGVSGKIKEGMKIKDEDSFKKTTKKVTIINFFVLGVLFIFVFSFLFFQSIPNFLFSGWAEDHNLFGYVFGIPFLFLVGYDSFYFTAKTNYEKKIGIYGKDIEKENRIRIIINRIFYILFIANVAFFYYQIEAMWNIEESKFFNTDFTVYSLITLIPIIAIIIATSFKIKK